MRWFSKIVDSKRKSGKLTWSLFYLLLTLFCCYSVVESIYNYLKYEVVTKTSAINEMNSEFPTVTICSRNSLVNIFKEIEEDEKDREIFKNLSQEEKIYFLLSHVNSSGFEKQSVLELKDFIPHCKFNGNSCDYENDFSSWFDYIFGNCFKFNSGKNLKGNQVKIKKLDQTGKMFGLQLIVSSYGSKYSLQEESLGINIMVHNSSINPVITEGIEISPNIATDLAINRLFISKIEYPFSDCVTDKKNSYYHFESTKLKTEYKYHQFECNLYCLQDFIISKTGCYYPFFNYKLNNVRKCSTVDDIRKFIAANKDAMLINATTSMSEKVSCNNKCPVECDTIEYNPIITQSIFPRKLYQKILGNDAVNNSNINVDIALNIFYNKMYYTKIEEVVKIEFVDLLSNIGGAMGLFIGFNILNVLEIFEYLLISILTIIKSRKVNANKHYITAI